MADLRTAPLLLPPRVMVAGEVLGTSSGAALPDDRTMNAVLLALGILLFLGFAVSFYGDLSSTVYADEGTEVFSDTRF